MSVLIKGMGMPESCIECECFDNEYLCCDITHYAIDVDELYVKRDDACPLVEVPKHGRLIDADELNFSSMLDSIDQGIAEETVMDAPTIIEAEE